jgi:hypothetical protein
VEHKCKKCGTSWRVLSDDDQWWNELANKREGFIPDHGVLKWLEDHTDLEEVDRKSILYHHVMEFGECRACSEELPEQGIVECSNCSALNYNFPGTRT